MIEHKCNKCNVIFYKKSHLIQHLNKKIQCGRKLNNNNEILENPKKSKKISNYNYDEIPINIIKPNDNTDIPTCLYCKKTFYQVSNLNKHIKNSCKVKKEQDEKKEEIFKELLIKEKMLKEKDEIIKDQQAKFNILFEQNLKLIERIDKITEASLSNSKKNNSSKKITNNKNCNNTTTNTTNNTLNTTNNGIIFNLVNYGKEDLDKIDIKHFINNVVKNSKICGVKIPEEILKLIHFNPAYPELNNIYISDINREKCMIYDDGMWKLTPDDKIPEVIDKVVSFSYEKENELREKYPDNKPLLDRLDTINKYTKLNDLEYLEELKEEHTEEIANNTGQIKRCEEFQKKTYDTFKTTLYNEGIKIKKKQAKI